MFPNYPYTVEQVTLQTLIANNLIHARGIRFATSLATCPGTLSVRQLWFVRDLINRVQPGTYPNIGPRPRKGIFTPPQPTVLSWTDTEKEVEDKEKEFLKDLEEWNT